ncbi:MAG: SDR family NAD(P)-dependent oxidoreductase, partial [Exiguobacterium undae]
MREEELEQMHQQARGQTQDQQPGIESEMNPEPVYDDPEYVGSGKLKGKVALITGGDSGIGRAVAIAYAKEGANIAIVYLNEGRDAEKTKQLIEGYGVKALAFAKDVSQPENAQPIIDQVIQEFGQLNILVNNAGKQFPQDDFL